MCGDATTDCVCVCVCVCVPLVCYVHTMTTLWSAGCPAADHDAERRDRSGARACDGCAMELVTPQQPLRGDSSADDWLRDTYGTIQYCRDETKRHGAFPCALPCNTLHSLQLQQPAVQRFVCLSGCERCSSCHGGRLRRFSRLISSVCVPLCIVLMMLLHHVTAVLLCPDILCMCALCVCGTVNNHCWQCSQCPFAGSYLSGWRWSR